MKLTESSLKNLIKQELVKEMAGYYDKESIMRRAMQKEKSSWLADKSKMVSDIKATISKLEARSPEQTLTPATVVNYLNRILAILETNQADIQATADITGYDKNLGKGMSTVDDVRANVQNASFGKTRAMDESRKK